MIRELRATDKAAWAALWRDYLAFYQSVLPEEVYETTWRRLLDPAEPVWGALAVDEAGVPVGLTHFIYHRTAWAIAETCYLQDLFVAPAVRGGGHGRGLIGHVADRARAHGATRLYWLTHEDNAAARQLYDAVAQRSGFIQYRQPL
ncbi:MAG: GNAT family N-acetyltransferase [Hyphomicrobiales bacterium]|nr:MAG: GNAT family N-acetyltransferase [Hyphomicrobiales bacterium]